jgi:hypothetical protein
MELLVGKMKDIASTAFALLWMVNAKAFGITQVKGLKVLSKTLFFNLPCFSYYYSEKGK